MKPLNYNLNYSNRNGSGKPQFDKRKLFFILLTVFLCMGFIKDTAKAQTGIKLYDYSAKSSTTYTGKQVTATLNGTVISKKETPGILVNEIALLPYDDIFKNSSIAAECTYNSKKGTLSIAKSGTVIAMTIGSTKAVVNGKAVTLPVAPRKIRYEASGNIKVLVPSRYIAQLLGLSYAWNSDTNIVAMKRQTLLLSYNGGKQIEYSSTQGNVILNGKKINLGSIPVIIINDTAMLQAKKVFENSSIAADYQYDKKNKTLTLSRNGKVLVMTVGSKTALLNGKKTTMNAAPLYVKNMGTGIACLMVPGEFTATSLGCGYTWDKAAKASVITSDNKSSSGNSGNNSNNSNNSNSEKVIKEWIATSNQYGLCSQVHEISSSESASGQTGTIYAVSRNYSDVKPNAETYMVASDVPFHRITSSASGNKITIQADNQQCSSKTWQISGTSGNMVDKISATGSLASGGTVLEFDTISDSYQYDVALSEDKLILYVTVYQNVLTYASVGINKSGDDYLILNGNKPLQASVTEAGSCITINIPNTTGLFDSAITNLSGLKYIRQLSFSEGHNQLQAVLSLNEGYQYSYKENGNQFMITFQSKGTDTSSIDKSQYNVIIPKPQAVTAAMLSDEDYYLNNYFIITLQGNYVDAINNSTITNQAAAVKTISASLNREGNTDIKIATSKLQGYKLACDNSNIYVYVDNPKSVYKNIVVLDPGHGGGATGAKNNGTNEKDLNFNILYTVGKKYFNQDTSKLKVYYTRTSDVDMTLKERAAFADKVGADLFVSLHMNSAPNVPKACGTEVFYSVNNNKATSAGLTSQKLASLLLEQLYPALGTSKRGVKYDDFTVIYRNTVPAVLIELGFLTNSSDYAVITDAAKQDTAASVIYSTLLKTFELYPTGR